MLPVSDSEPTFQITIINTGIPRGGGGGGGTYLKSEELCLNPKNSGEREVSTELEKAPKQSILGGTEFG